MNRLHTSAVRATYGCLRVDDATIEELAPVVQAALEAGEEAIYECLDG